MAKKSFPLRLDEPIFDLLKQWADDEFRSVNGQVEYLLREALRNSGRLKRPAATNDAVPQSSPDDTFEETDQSE
jgi:hypothetical protein